MIEIPNRRELRAMIDGLKPLTTNPMFLYHYGIRLTALAIRYAWSNTQPPTEEMFLDFCRQAWRETNLEQAKDLLTPHQSAEEK